MTITLAWRHTAARRDLLLGSLNATTRARQLIDPAGRVVLANDAFERLFHTADIALPQLLLSRVSTGSDAAEILRQLILTVAEGGRGRTEIEIPLGDGQTDWFDVSGRSIAGFPGFVLWGAEKVTAQRQIEDFIRSDHETFADLIEHAPIGFYSVDENGRFLFVNSTLASWLGLLPDNEGGYRLTLHDLVADVLPPDTQPYSPFRDHEARSGEVALSAVPMTAPSRPSSVTMWRMSRRRTGRVSRCAPDRWSMISVASGNLRVRCRSRSSISSASSRKRRPASFCSTKRAGWTRPIPPSSTVLVGAEWAQARFVDLVQPEERPDISVEEVQEHANVIRELDPKPGFELMTDEVRYITPDLLVERVGEDYVVFLNDKNIPRLRISNAYKRELDRSPTNGNKETRDFILGRLSSARWLIQTIEQRRKTIVKVMECIVDEQRDFFEKGPGFLRPLTLQQVASRIGMHESTVSRVTTNKYVQTPRGVFELKYFFSSSLDTEDGDEVAGSSPGWSVDGTAGCVSGIPVGLGEGEDIQDDNVSIISKIASSLVVFSISSAPRSHRRD